MKKTSFSRVVLLGMSLTLPAWAEAPANNPSEKPAVGQPKKAPPSKPGAAGEKTGPGPRQVGAPGPHGMMGRGLSSEDMARRAETMKERMAEHAEKLAGRAKELREKAQKARAEGDVKQAEQMEKAAERLEKGPVPPQRGPGWQKAMEKRKRARLKPLWRQYGESLKKPEVREEFKKHAVRMARLDRMRELARNNPKEEERKKLIERVNMAVAKENVRHRQTLRTMISKEQEAVANPTSEIGTAVATPPVEAKPRPEDEAKDEEPAEEAK